jgi:hypothetical protein
LPFGSSRGNRFWPKHGTFSITPAKCFIWWLILMVISIRAIYDWHFTLRMRRTTFVEKMYQSAHVQKLKFLIVLYLHIFFFTSISVSLDRLTCFSFFFFFVLLCLLCSLLKCRSFGWWISTVGSTGGSLGSGRSRYRSSSEVLELNKKRS